jgi:hypothetical protein
MKFIINIIRRITNKPIKRSNNTMSKNQGKLDALMVCIEEYIDATVEAAIEEKLKGLGKTNTKKPKETKATKKSTKADEKKQLKALMAEAKQLGTSIMGEHGRPKLAEMLKDMGISKFSELKELDDLEKFIEKAKNLDSPEEIDEEDDLLGLDEPEAKEYTVEDVKAILREVKEHDELGATAIKQILSEFGTARLMDLREGDFAGVHAAAEKALDNVK